jgi:hypothetical protein
MKLKIEDFREYLMIFLQHGIVNFQSSIPQGADKPSRGGQEVDSPTLGALNASVFDAPLLAAG